MSSLPTILVLTSADYGQANVNLATSYELALAGVNVCIASFAPLQARVSRLQELINRHASRRSSTKPTGSIRFCECKGVTPYMDALAKYGIKSTNIAHPHGVSGAIKCYSIADITVFPWSPEEHLAAIETVKEMIAAIKPNLMVIEPSSLFAIDACRLVGQKFAILFPNSIKDIAGHLQPHLAMAWKYPALGSGFLFPLSWWRIPLNIYLFIRLIIQAQRSNFPNVRKVQDLRKSLGIASVSGFEIYPGVTYVCPALRETDFPFTVIPEQLLLCGPIVMPFDPLEEVDPTMTKWLNSGPTVLVSLGSHVVSDGKLAREMASAFRIMLDYHSRKNNVKIQVLWKAKASEDIQKTINDVIGKEIDEGWVKVVPWLEAEPVSILQHPNVICTVHHGGANSFYEGIWAGLPHVVLPVWFDTYDYANRAEFLKIGIFGNRRCSPGVQAEEFSDALVRVTGDTQEAIEFKAAAGRLKELCQKRGNGRQLSSAAILKEIGITV